MEQTICQSCAMPLTSEDMYSTEKDGSINKDYCKWCYKDGEFVDKVSTEDYIETCSKFSVPLQALRQTYHKSLHSV